MIVYAGAILVLYLFVIMLLNLKTEERGFHKRYAVIGLVALAIVGPVAILVRRSPYAGAPGEATQALVLSVGHTRALGITIFRDYLLPFELIGLYLLAAIIGAIVLVKTPAMQERRAQAGADPAPEPPRNGSGEPAPVGTGVGDGRGGRGH